MSHMNESCHIWMSHVKYEWVYCYLCCHVWMSHVTCEWVMSHMNESCQVWMSVLLFVLSRMNESTHIWMSHVTYEWVMSSMNECIVICIVLSWWCELTWQTRLARRYTYIYVDSVQCVAVSVLRFIDVCWNVLKCVVVIVMWFDMTDLLGKALYRQTNKQTCIHTYIHSYIQTYM